MNSTLQKSSQASWAPVVRVLGVDGLISGEYVIYWKWSVNSSVINQLRELQLIEL